MRIPIKVYEKVGEYYGIGELPDYNYGYPYDMVIANEGGTLYMVYTV